MSKQASCPFCLASKKDQKTLIRLGSIGEPNKRFSGTPVVSSLNDRELYCLAITGLRILADILTEGKLLNEADHSDFVLGYEKTRESLVEMAKRATLKNNQETKMPSVGKGKNKKKFPYTKAGKKAAANHAKKTGSKKTSRKGGY